MDDSLAVVEDLPYELNHNCWRLNKGISCSEWFPEGIDLQISNDYGVVLADAIPNYNHLLIVSEKLKQLLYSANDIEIEFFSVNVMDKKGRAVSHPYYVANVLKVVDCVDREKSEFRMDPIIKHVVDQFSYLVFDEKNMCPEDIIFRLKSKPELVIVNDSFSDVLLDAGYTGFYFEHIDDFGAEYRK